MKTWIDEEAVLAVDAGTGWISRYELEGLIPGSVVRSVTEAGTGCPISLNGAFFAQGSAVVIDLPGNGGAVLGAFIDSLEESEARLSPPRRGDRASELLPFAIRLGSIRVRLRDLDGTGVSSLVNLDRAVGSTCDADLVVAGIPVASGKVAVIGENMGIRIETLTASLPAGSFPRTTGAALAPGYSAEPVKDYNFRMPDCFTKRAITRFADIHLDFLRGWQARLPEFSGWELSLVDQLNYGEWLDDIAGKELSFAAFTPARRVRAYDREVRARMPETFLVESGASRVRLEGDVLEGVRAWAAMRLGEGDEIPFQIARDAGRQSVPGDDGLEITLACLRNAWLDAGDLRIGMDAGAEPVVFSDKPFYKTKDNRSRMILIARFTRADGSRMDVVYPQGLIAPHLPALGR